MPFMLAFLAVPITWGEILRRTFKDAFYKDNVLGMAAQLAYYFFFALFPTLLVVMAIADMFAADVVQMLRGLGGFIPQGAIDLITRQLASISEGQQGGLLTIGLLTALWSSSAAMVAIIETLNTAYDIEEARPWWKVRLTAIALTIGISVFIVAAFALVVIGPTVAEQLATRLGLGAAFEWTWKIAQWPVVFLLVSGGISLVYYFAPDAEQDWVWLTPGSLAATALWLVASLAFKFYIANFGGYESYGVIGTVMVLMLWFYLSGLVILMGAEMNAEIEHASEYGKEPGEKVPGQKRKIGPALKRDWEAQQRARAVAPQPVVEVRPKVGGEVAAPLPQSAPAYTATAPRSRWTDWLIGTPVVLAQALWTVRSFRRRSKA